MSHDVWKFSALRAYPWQISPGIIVVLEIIRRVLGGGDGNITENVDDLNFFMVSTELNISFDSCV